MRTHEPPRSEPRGRAPRARGASFRSRARGAAAALFALLALGAPRARAETLSWEQVKARAGRVSPAALEGIAAVQAARAEAAGAGRWPRSNPVLSGAVETGRWTGAPGEYVYSAGIEQSLDVVGVAALAGKAAERGVAAARQEARVRGREALAGAAEAYVELERMQRTLDVRAALDAAFLRVAEIGRRTAEAGETSRLDALLGEAQSGESGSELAEARAELAEAQARLALLVGARAPGSLRVRPLDVPPPEPRSLAQLRRLALARRPEPAAFRARLAAAEARSRLAARSAFPEPTLSFGVRTDRIVLGRDDALGDPGGLLGFRDPDTSLEAGFAIPLPLFDRNQAERARARADVAAARRAMSLAETAALADVEAAHVRLRAAWDALARWRGIEPKLDEAARLLERGFVAGELGRLETLVGMERIARARIRALDARAAYLRAVFGLKLALGEEP